MCITRTTSSVQVKVVGTKENSLGVTDIFTCLLSILESSPEIITNLANSDFAVYSTDYSEPGLPAVGHGLFTWILLSSSSTTPKASETMREILKARDNKVSLLGIPDERLAIGKVCPDALSLFSNASESLEVQITLSPVNSFTQKEYLTSLDLYRSLSQFLPTDFDHPAWSRFVSDSRIMEKILHTILEKDPSQQNILKRLKDSGSTPSEKSASDTDLPERKHDLPQLNNNLPKNEEERSTQIKRQHSNAFQTEEEDLISATSFQYQSFTESPQLLKIYKSDLTLENSSPAMPQSVLTDPYQLPMSVPDHIHMNWYDSKSSPASTSPNFHSVALSRQSSLVAPLSDPNFSTPYSADTPTHTDRVVAYGRKAKPKESEDKWSLQYCENCGQLESRAWRKTKVIIDGVEQIYMLCNPCGLWSQKRKNSLRPKELWETTRKQPTETDSIKEKKPRRIPPPKNKSESPSEADKLVDLPKTKSPGPTIAEQLALNISKGRQNKSELSVRTHAMLYRSPEASNQDDVSLLSTTSADSANPDQGSKSGAKPDSDQSLTIEETPKEPVKVSNGRKPTGRKKKPKKITPSSTPKPLAPLMPMKDITKPTFLTQGTKQKSIYTKSTQPRRKSLPKPHDKLISPDQSKSKSNILNQLHDLHGPSPKTTIPNYLSTSISKEKTPQTESFPISDNHINDEELSEMLFNELLSGNIYDSTTGIHNHMDSSSKMTDINIAQSLDELASELGIYEDNQNSNFVDDVWPYEPGKDTFLEDVMNANISAKATPIPVVATETTQNGFFYSYPENTDDKSSKMTLPSSPPNGYFNNEDNWSDDGTPLEE